MPPKIYKSQLEAEYSRDRGTYKEMPFTNKKPLID